MIGYPPLCRELRTRPMKTLYTAKRTGNAWYDNCVFRYCRAVPGVPSTLNSPGKRIDANLRQGLSTFTQLGWKRHNVAAPHASSDMLEESAPPITAGTLFKFLSLYCLFACAYLRSLFQIPLFFLLSYFRVKLASAADPTWTPHRS